MPDTAYPTPTKTSARTAFAIEYFAEEADAERAGALVAGHTATDWYTTLSGRDTAFDYFDTDLGIKLYAVVVI